MAVEHIGDSVSQQVREFGGDLAGGVALGLVTEIVALEGYVHQDLSHRNLRFSPLLAGISHTAMIASGLSPNRAALHHRVHHTKVDVLPRDVTGSVGAVLEFTNGTQSPSDVERDMILFPGYDIAGDSLLKEINGELEFRHDSAIERAAGKNRLVQILPIVAVGIGMGAVNRALGRDRPFAKAAVFMGGFLSTLTAETVATTYAEARSGTDDGQLRAKGLLAGQLDRHQQHHDAPADYEAGAARRYKTTFSLLKKIGLIDTHQKADESIVAEG